MYIHSKYKTDENMILRMIFVYMFKIIIYEIWRYYIIKWKKIINIFFKSITFVILHTLCMQI